MELEQALDAAFSPEPANPPAPEVVSQEVPQAPEVPAPPADQPAPEPAQPTEQPQQQDHAVPLPKYLDERERRKEAERRAAELEARFTQQPNAAPDPFDDPQGFAAFQQQQVANQVAEVRFQMSDQMARQVHGTETVDQAIAWAGERAQSDPVFAASYMREANPIDWIVRQHKRDAVVSQIGDRPLDDFIKDYVAKNPALLAGIAPAVAPAIPPAAIPQQAPPPAAPPRSLVNEPSSGGVDHTPLGLKAGVEAVFPR